MDGALAIGSDEITSFVNEINQDKGTVKNTIR